jgi:hypothetical protein
MEEVLIDELLQELTILQRSPIMSIGSVFFVIAAIVLFLGGIGSTIIPNSVIWGLFCMTLGLLLNGCGFNFHRNN